ncbi:DUF2461 domain-containing protein [Aquimarina sp. AD10]|uniref:DUF2461 domain-containing protein n=1 Tax=Aquimarina sp. AD10 TaxID=1714849 RepID=UPI000E47451C|nr:DUF2461 domain-containing protein [Aquimarina sp. AD10]AXT61028.1 DUF2461 domain-containing protein [Aquimarina sp. AD10]RKM96326.1 TIGR02453 family protein [Aquimarina sp. AD10]
MDFNILFEFLHDLQNNNHKDWMDANRKQYHSVRNSFVKWLDQVDGKLATIDPEYYPTPGKKGINRINNNLLFHPNKPVYKDHFGAGLDQRTKQGDFYIHIGLSECLIAGGYWKPDNKILNSIREAIDYDGEKLINILNKKSFKNVFGGLLPDEDKLKTAPKGYSSDHQHIDLLRHKTFAVIHPLNREDILKDDFMDRVLTVYKEMLPFRRYLNQAVTV